jgi:LysM repeat protein
VALKEMSTVLDAEREALELESIPEYLSDSQLPSREAAVSMSSRAFTEREQQRPEVQSNFSPARVEREEEKSDELEALWPGVHHDFAPQKGKSPSFYITLGFMAGAAISIISVFGYSTVSNLVAHNNNSGNATNAIADAPKQVAQPTAIRTQGGGEVLVPASPQVQVQTGDTLAAIALRNYKRVSPRLLDEICKANSLRNANVLSLGQKLALPEYHTQANQIAGTGQFQ